MRVVELGGRLPEGGVARLVVAVGVPGGGVGDAPVDGLGVAGELGADLAHPIAQADHPIEPLLGEHAQVLRAVPGQIDAVLVPHHPHGVGVQGLGVAAGAVGLDQSAGAGPGQGLGHLRAGAVAGAQEQHPRRRRRSAGRCVGRGGTRRSPGCRASPVAASSSPRRVRSTV